LVDPIKYFSGVVKGAIICGQIMLVGSLCLAVPQELRYLFPAQSCLNQSSRCGAPQTAKAQPVRFAVFNSGAITSRFESSLDGCDPKDGFGIILLGLFPKCFELQAESITNLNDAGLHGLSSECANPDLCFLDVSPFQTEDLTGSHSGIESTDQDRSQVFYASGTRRKQSGFLFEGQNAYAFSLVSHRDQWLAFAKRTASDPSFSLCDIEEAPQQGELAVHTGETSSLTAFGISAKSLCFIGLEIGIRDRTDGAVFEKRVQGASVAANGVTGTQARHFAIINVDRGNRVSIEIPLHRNRKLNAGTEASDSIQSLPLFESIAQTITSFGLCGAGAPESFALSVLHPGNASIDVSIADYDLNFMIAGHLLSDKLYIRRSDHDGKSNREMDSDIAGDKNQAVLKGVDVLSYFGQDYDGETDLTSNQKVAGSSPAGCTMTRSGPETVSILSAQLESSLRSNVPRSDLTLTLHL
jgi:hypothetical protein